MARIVFRSPEIDYFFDYFTWSQFFLLIQQCSLKILDRIPPIYAQIRKLRSSAQLPSSPNIVERELYMGLDVLSVESWDYWSDSRSSKRLIWSTSSPLSFSLILLICCSHNVSSSFLSTRCSKNFWITTWSSISHYGLRVMKSESGQFLCLRDVDSANFEAPALRILSFSRLLTVVFIDAQWGRSCSTWEATIK